jgi:glycosyltransferase involved in cell wall biosynthesis
MGHPLLVSGRGEDIRMGAGAFAASGIPFGIRNIFPWSLEGADVRSDFPLADMIDKPHAADVNVFFLNADEMASAYQHLGEAVFHSKYNIGYWAWELSEFPDAWKNAFRYVDEIWAPTRFTMQALAAKARCPVVHMPLPVELPEALRIRRGDLGLPERGFLFLFCFDFSSYVNRKNPWAVINAFKQACSKGNLKSAYLIVKLNGGHVRPDDYKRFLSSVSPDDSRIIVLDKVLDSRGMRALMNSCDCFISLHRAEGFGRGPAEAMYYRKPVIVTGYSGNMDFTNEANACIVDYRLIPVGPGEYPFGDGQLWADADIEQAAWYIRRIYSDSVFRTSIADAGQQFIRAYHSFSVLGSRYRRRLIQIKKA